MRTLVVATGSALVVTTNRRVAKPTPHANHAQFGRDPSDSRQRGAIPAAAILDEVCRVSSR